MLLAQCRLPAAWGMLGLGGERRLLMQLHSAHHSCAFCEITWTPSCTALPLMTTSALSHCRCLNAPVPVPAVQAHSGLSFLYTAFNKGVVDKAEQDFPPNVECCTTHKVGTAACAVPPCGIACPDSLKVYPCRGLYGGVGTIEAASLLRLGHAPPRPHRSSLRRLPAHRSWRAECECGCRAQARN